MSGWGGESKGKRVIEVQNDIGAKPFRKNTILHSDGGKLKREKTIQASQAVDWGLGKRVHVIFLCRFMPLEC